MIFNLVKEIIDESEQLILDVKLPQALRRIPFLREFLLSILKFIRIFLFGVKMYVKDFSLGFISFMVLLTIYGFIRLYFKSLPAINDNFSFFLIPLTISIFFFSPTSRHGNFNAKSTYIEEIKNLIINKTSGNIDIFHSIRKSILYFIENSNKRINYHQWIIITLWGVYSAYKTFYVTILISMQSKPSIDKLSQTHQIVDLTNAMFIFLIIYFIANCYKTTITTINETLKFSFVEAEYYFSSTQEHNNHA